MNPMANVQYTDVDRDGFSVHYWAKDVVIDGHAEHTTSEGFYKVAQYIINHPEATEWFGCPTMEHVKPKIWAERVLGGDYNKSNANTETDALRAIAAVVLQWKLQDKKKTDVYTDWDNGFSVHKWADDVILFSHKLPQTKPNQWLKIATYVVNHPKATDKDQGLLYGTPEIWAKRVLNWDHKEPNANTTLAALQAIAQCIRRWKREEQQQAAGVDRPRGFGEPETRPSWTDTFIDVAEVVARRATCKRLHVGAVLVNPEDRTIIATGYNGAPRGEPHCTEDGCLMEDGHCVRTLHAEENVIIQAARQGSSTRGTELYLLYRPCYRCAVRIAQAGIRALYYRERYHRITDTTREDDLFRSANIEVWYAPRGQDPICEIMEVPF